MRLTGALAGVAMAAAVVGCSASSKHTASTATFPNPVSIINRTACIPASGVTNGELSVAGDFMVASCTFDSQEMITVKTFKTAAAKQAELGANRQPQDSQKTIVGSDWVMYVNGVFDAASGGVTYNPDPSVLASQTGGTVAG